MVVSDLFVFATAVWMMMTLYYNNGGLEAWTRSGAAETLDFFNAYVVARAFFLGPMAVGTFIRALKVFATIAIILAMADVVYGHLFIHHIFASIVGSPPPGEQERMGIIRANSSFDHAILFGAFCAVVGNIFLYSEQSALRQVFWVGLCFFGVILSVTSAALMSICISLAAYTYDRLLKQHRRRWTAFWILLAVVSMGFVSVSGHPIGWLILHLTLDPHNGYYRLMVWNEAMPVVANSPWIGKGIPDADESQLLSVDCVWLAYTIRYGYPAISLLFLANVTAFLPAHEPFNSQVADPYMKRIRTGFTAALIMLMFIGLSVHYWSYIVIFWGLCLGLRASFREQSIVADRVPRRRAVALAS